MTKNPNQKFNIPISIDISIKTHQCTEVRFASFLFGGFITAIVVNSLERKMAKRTSEQFAVYHVTKPS